LRVYILKLINLKDLSVTKKYLKTNLLQLNRRKWYERNFKKQLIIIK